MVDMRLSVWQFLPTGPTAYGDSPYQPLSTFAGNELLIDVGELIAMNLLDETDVRELTTLPADFIDYGGLIPISERVLQLATARFSAQANAKQRSAYQAFVQKHNESWLHDYALFRILKTQHDERPWPEWQPKFVHRDPVEMRALEASAAAEIEAIKVAQFFFHSQWARLRIYANAKGVRLFGDMPICIALDSADAWARPDILRIDADGRPDFVAGVPPDYFSVDGQLWGNPLYAWEAHAANDYQWWIERMRASVEIADFVRIDHFRGFEAYWSVPAGAKTARHGSWEPGPGDAIFDALNKALGPLPIVAEDLGVITPAVEAMRDRHNIPGMVVLQFDIAHDGFDLSQVPENCVCYTGTHDNDTTLGWFRGSVNDIRSKKEIERTRCSTLRLTGGTDDTVHTDLIKAAFSTSAKLAIAPMQDYLGLGSEARINTPGTSRNNWRWRVGNEQITPGVCRQVAQLVSDSNRTI
jgi:4-alpha-glucanotransferase